MWTSPVQSGAFMVDVATSSNGGHPPEFWARRAAERIIQVSETADPALREQALAFKEKVERVILLHMKNAIDSDRSTVCHMVTEAGHPKLAEIIRRP